MKEVTFLFLLRYPELARRRYYVVANAATSWSGARLCILAPEQ